MPEIKPCLVNDFLFPVLIKAFFSLVYQSGVDWENKTAFCFSSSFFQTLTINDDENDGDFDDDDGDDCGNLICEYSGVIDR